MSLDLYIISEKPVKKKGTGIFIRESGESRELVTQEEVDKYFPGHTADIVEIETCDYWSGNITHNLGQMANNCKIEGDMTLYKLLWRPDENGYLKLSEDYLDKLREGRTKLKEQPEYYKKWSPENGWGSYENLLNFVESLISAIEKLNPDTYGEFELYASR